MQEEQEKQKNEVENLRTKANKKHDAQSYHKVKKQSVKQQMREAQEAIAEQTGSTYTAYNQGRLDDLAKPVDKGVHKMMYDLKCQADEAMGKNVGIDKEAKIVEKIQQKKKIDLVDYVDRDIPPIRGDTGEFDVTTKTSKGLKSFNTKTDNKGLFSNLTKEPPMPYEVQQKKE